MWKMSFLKRYLLYMEKELVITVIAFQNPIHSGQTLPLGNAFCYSILTTFPPDNDKNVSRLQCILKCTPVFDLKLKVVKYVMITLSLIGR